MFFSQDVLRTYRFDAEGFAEYFRCEYYRNVEIVYPIDPFSVLKNLDIHYTFRNLGKLDGLLLPDTDGTGINLVAINSKRPIQKGRYSCAHELCHFLKDAGNPEFNPLKCIPGSRSHVERYAESFAASFLMPREEMKKKVSECIKKCYLSMDDILYIADYFGVSFASCIVRIKQVMPDSLSDDVDAQAKKYRPNKRRQELGLSDRLLIEQVFDSWDDAWDETYNSRATLVYKNQYIYNDARLEGVDSSEEAVGEILADLRLNSQASQYCSSEYAAYDEVAGHSALYDHVFSYSQEKSLSVYTMTELNRILFSFVPYPEFGGRTRTQNTAVLGAKFDTVDYRDVMSELIKLDKDVQYLEQDGSTLKKSEIIKAVARIHHRLTVIHPFSDGNGRTIRAFMNLLLLRNGIPPVFIELDRKMEYLDALSKADSSGDFDALYEILLKGALKSHSNYFSFRS